MQKLLGGASLIALAVVVAATGVSPARAANTAATQVDEVVVTARKRSERIQEVPMTVTALSAADLERSNPRDLKDVLRQVPGLSFSGADLGQSRYTIRGISSASPSPTVGIYLDDVSLVTVTTNFSGAIDPVFFDFSRLEVLKGPQGTLYGGNAMGGAIKYVSHAPDLSNLSLDVAGGLAGVAHGKQSYNAEAVLNLPLKADVLALRVGVNYRGDAGYVDNIPNAPAVNYLTSTSAPPNPLSPLTKPSLSTRSDADQNSDNVYALKMALLWQPDASLEITPQLFHQNYHQKNASIFWTNLPALTSSFRLAQPTRDGLDVYSLSAVKHLRGVDLTWLTGQVDRSVAWDRDYSFYIGILAPAFYGLNSPNASDSKTRTFSQELRASSSDPAARLRWTAGLYYSKQKDVLDQAVNTLGVGAALGTGTDTVYHGVAATRTTQYAGFGELTYALLPTLDASLGLRAFRVEQSVNTTGDGILNGGHTHAAGSSSQDGVNPKFELSYRAADNHLIYASAAKGFRPGGSNPSAVAPGLCAADLASLHLSSVPAGYQSDKLWTYETGSKNQFLDRRLTVNGAAYYTDWQNIQQKIFLPSCGFSFTGNAATAVVKGGEVSAEYEVIEGLTLSGTASYADARITRSSVGISAKVGQAVLDTPKWIANTAIAYRFPVPGQGLGTFRAEYQYRSSSLRGFETTLPVSTPTGVTTAPNITQIQSGYEQVNLDLGLAYGRYKYSIYVTNAFDRGPRLDYDVINGLTQATTVRPRTIGISLRAGF
ncbi:TonB-dependent receptor [Phenylobacterium sp.]|uniref:TonB-dependent receptor n=1 Tax=Phenylobacterium sp. TaxID=1871053 RepID=UPI0035637F5A